MVLLVLVYTVVVFLFVFFFNDTATTEIYTLSLHDALPILPASATIWAPPQIDRMTVWSPGRSRSQFSTAASSALARGMRSEEHTSELQSRQYLVCRLLLEKKKNNAYTPYMSSVCTYHIELT